VSQEQLKIMKQYHTRV